MVMDILMKSIDFNYKKNKTKQKYDIIEIPVNESIKLKPKPQLRENSAKTDSHKIKTTNKILT